LLCALKRVAAKADHPHFATTTGTMNAPEANAHWKQRGDAEVPRQNRVTPFGDIIATPERGMFMGNRGVLHDSEGQIKRRWQVKRWIVCVLAFRGRNRRIMTPGRWTELFFFDEATALAAGHRPCSECQHARFIAFCNAWGKACGKQGSRPMANKIDLQLQAERLDTEGSKRSYFAGLDELPDGVFVTVSAWGEQAFLLWDSGLFAWSSGGYGERRKRPNRNKVRVLTPKSTVATIVAGYVPEIHASVLTQTRII
jgi:hypothetical protein